MVKKTKGELAEFLRLQSKKTLEILSLILWRLQNENDKELMYQTPHFYYLTGEEHFVHSPARTFIKKFILKQKL